MSALEARVEAMVRLLLDDGHMTPVAAHQLRRVLYAERQWGTALLLGKDQGVGVETLIDPHPHSGGEAAALAVLGEYRNGWEVVPVWRHPAEEWQVAREAWPGWGELHPDE